MATPGVPRPGNAPPYYNPSSVTDGMQNLQINRPTGPPGYVGPRPPTPLGQQPPPPFSSSAQRPSSFSGSYPTTRPGAPPPGVHPGGPPQATLPQNVASNRPSGPPPPFGSRPPPPGSLPSSMSTSGVPPGAFPSTGQVALPSSHPNLSPFGSSSPLTTGPIFPPSSAPGPASNGPAAFGSGGMQRGPQFPSAGSTPPPLSSRQVGPAPPMLFTRAPSPVPNMRPLHGSPPTGAPSGPMQPPPFALPFASGMPPPSGSLPFGAPLQGVSPPSGSPYGQQAWQMQPRQVAPAPPIPGSSQPPRMFGMPPQPPDQSMATISPAMGHMGAPMAGPSKIDPNQIPRPVPSISVILHETRQGNQANLPPIPCTVDLLSTSGMQLALMVQPLALPHPSEEPIQLVDFGESGPVRCSRCKGYVNPFMKFIDQGRRFVCNLCGYTDETPSDYQCNLGPDGRRRDADERPELCRGTVEFVATKEYMVRDPMPAVFFFLIDVSMNAIQIGATAAACSAISQVIADLPDGPRTMVGVATFDSTIHFYNLKRELQQEDVWGYGQWVVSEGGLGLGSARKLGWAQDLVVDTSLTIMGLKEDKDDGKLLTSGMIQKAVSIEGTPSFLLAKKLKLKKQDMKRLIREEFGRLEHQELMAIGKVPIIDKIDHPLMLIVPDVQDVYTPLQADVIVQLSECRQHLELLLENIPTMFENNRTADSAFGAAVKAGFLAMKNTGGKLLVFQSVLPSVGIGALSAREAEGRTNISAGEKEAHKLLQPADKILKAMAVELAEYQVCVDVFITTQTYVDIASISVIPRTTGGKVYYYFPFSALSEPAKLYNDLRWNVTRPQGFEAVMRVRCSQGIQVQEYSGNFCKRIPTDVDLPTVAPYKADAVYKSVPPTKANECYMFVKCMLGRFLEGSKIDCDKTIMVTLKHDDKLQDGSECAFQCALLYTTVYGQRRIRVSTLSLPCTTLLSNLFRSADLDTQFACFLKQVANEIPSSPLPQVREQVTNLCINILHSYRKFCATVSSAGQLILPEALKLLPLYTLALIKSTGLRTDGRIDDRSFWISYVSSISTALAIPLVYPRMVAIQDLISKETDGSIIPPSIPLSSEHVNDDGIYLLENGEDCLIYVGSSVDPGVMRQLFGISSLNEIQPQFVLQQYDNPLSKKLNDVVNEIRRQRCSYLRLKLCKKGDASGMLFFSYMVEDKTPNGLSYVEFLVHVHRQIQTKMP
ncbi:hypothetical protein RHMOL_Rhmol12G0160500 [Rhododendron molle]|uniref:Uncharacterized protein n=1 Tax=Rhododendron molle TaxID=49168 RepID=A0ACC0LJP2_RHOML|nr:hypothetical protein RHMOL_Rhmol12G0160500 [Rhododendron molle]